MHFACFTSTIKGMNQVIQEGVCYMCWMWITNSAPLRPPPPTPPPLNYCSAIPGRLPDAKQQPLRGILLSVIHALSDRITPDCKSHGGRLQ